MIDSVLKGTGNSRFLKSAVPTGTSWADALAMLQAGTFPIDFNGINTEGFQQVGTPLNKANLLKDATAAQIGLPPSTTPDGMFQALGNTGELHVWRKTVVADNEKPAGYTLGDVITNTDTWFSVDSSNGAVIHYASSVSVNNDGVASLVSESTINVSRANPDSNLSIFDVCKGKFAYVSGGSYNTKSSIFFIPIDAVFYRKGTYSNNYIYADKEQRVNAHGIIPAGTTTTYPVSTNRNAYQEGDDAKPAGYTLGEVVTGNRALTNPSYPTQYKTWQYGDSVVVSDDGIVSIQSPATVQVQGNSSNYLASAKSLIGKFVSCINAETDFDRGIVYYIPADASITMPGSVIYTDRYQPVTGYAAIPAGTTIEYLGKLGDKARVQVVSYVGTGTYGSGKETKIPVDFSPELLIIAVKDAQMRTVYISVPRSGTGLYLSADGSSYIYGEREATVSYVDGKVYIYSYAGEYAQMNANGYTYVAVALG